METRQTNAAENRREAARRLLDIQTIYLEPSVTEYVRGREILAQFPNAERIEVASHWQIPELHGNAGNIKNWIQIKRNVLVLGVKKSLQCPAYERSSDFIAPSLASGCAMACAYCYVPRRKGFANPISVFVNIEQIIKFLERHANRQGMKMEPTAPDPDYFVYELGTNSDNAADALISDNLKDTVALFRGLPNAKATFATKYVNRALLTYDPQRKTRLRFSLMPQNISKVVDIRTSKITERIAAVNDFVEAGWEVNFNFAPVIYYENWLEDYAALMDEINDTLDAASKAQMAAEIAFLTHNDAMHEVNMGWHPKGEDLLWKPDLQETKISGTGGKNLRYRRTIKSGLVREFCELVEKKMPYCAVRYAF